MMIALANASFSPDVASWLERERCWELRPVPQVRDAVAAMPDSTRRQVGAVIVESEPVDAALLERLDHLELVACMRSEPVNVDVAAATSHGVPVLYTPGRTPRLWPTSLLGSALPHCAISPSLTTCSLPGASPVSPPQTALRSLRVMPSGAPPTRTLRSPMSSTGA